MAQLEVTGQKLISLLKEECAESEDVHFLTNVIKVVNTELKLWEVDYNVLKKLQKIVNKKLSEFEDEED